MTGFSVFAKSLFENRKRTHLIIGLMTLLVLPGLPVSLTPADIESYDLESPELDATRVIQDEFTGNGVILGYIFTVTDSTLIPDVTGPLDPMTMATYSGVGEGIKSPDGGILNLTVLQELDRKANIVKEHETADHFGPLVSDITGTPVDGVLSLPDNFRSFMSNDTLLTQPSKEADGFFIVDVPPKTNWTDCGELECLTYDDSNVTQAHIDLAAHRMANNSNGAFLRWLSNDRAFVPDSNSPVIGPVNGTLDGEEWVGAEWIPGRWSAGSAWLLIQYDREKMLANGWTLSWSDAEQDWGYAVSGLGFEADPPPLSTDACLDRINDGADPCSTEWLFLDLEGLIRTEDRFTSTLLIGESPNVEVNRELLSSAWLIVLMGVAIMVLLWFSLRRWSDVGIVGIGLVLSLVWMQGSIGLLILFGDRTGLEVIERSQFSNLLPILILALGIDDSLHALHRYKEERRRGETSETAAMISLNRVGRAIMLTSLTTIAAFMANMFSGIPALRSFGLEAAIGVMAAFILTGLWVPLLRLDVDRWLRNRGRLLPEPTDLIRLVPQSWLAFTARISGAWAPAVFLLTVLVTAAAAPAMMNLEGDFQVEDFLDDESDFATGVFLVNERFAEEGEPAEILVEGDLTHPDVLYAVKELRYNMNKLSPDDPDRFAREPSGAVELLAIDELLEYAQFALWYNSTPFEATGWDTSLPENGVNCPYRGSTQLFVNFEDRGCIAYFFGHMYLHGIPESGGYPMIPASIVSNFIQPSQSLNSSQPWLDLDGNNATFDRMVLRFGLRQPEQFDKVELAIAELHRDLAPLQNLSATPLRERTDRDTANESYPITWTIETGSPITRYVQASRMQEELQGSLGLGVLFCLVTLWWGFRSSENRGGWVRSLISVPDRKLRVLIGPIGMFLFAGGLISLGVFLDSVPIEVAIALAIFALIIEPIWGGQALSLALLTTGPILIVVVWLYGAIAWFGYGLNMVTVAIATMSLGVGIDYVIHVVERFREERLNGLDTLPALSAVGAASGIALVGSALSDITGFIVISRSSMGFFSTFGLFSALMISLSLIASLILAPAALRIVAYLDFIRSDEGLESE